MLVFFVFFSFSIHEKAFLKDSGFDSLAKMGIKSLWKALFYSIHEYLFLYCTQPHKNFLEIQNIFSPLDNVSINTILPYMCFLPHFII